MPNAYSPEYREMVLEQVRAGRLASELSGELEVTESTIHRWIAQDKIDSGETDGLTTGEKAELTAAKARIRELEAELAATRLASELFAESRVVRPKRSTPSSLNSERQVTDSKPLVDCCEYLRRGFSVGNSLPRLTGRPVELC